VNRRPQDRIVALDDAIDELVQRIKLWTPVSPAIRLAGRMLGEHPSSSLLLLSATDKSTS